MIIDKTAKIRFRKIKSFGKTHYCFPIRFRDTKRKTYKPICIPNGRIYATIKDKSQKITCEKCLLIINNQS